MTRGWLARGDKMAINMYMKRVSVAQARNNLPALIHETETEPI